MSRTDAKRRHVLGQAAVLRGIDILRQILDDHEKRVLDSHATDIDRLGERTGRTMTNLKANLATYERCIGDLVAIESELSQEF